MANNIHALLLLLVIPFLQPASAIKCYTCNSKQDEKCKDPFQGPGPNLEPVDCTQDQHQRQQTRQAIIEVLNMMTKLGQVPVPYSSEPPIPAPNDTIPMACQKMEIDVLGERVTGRGCSSKPLGFYRPCDAIKVVTNKDIVLHHCSLCEEDGCNSANSVQFYLWTLLFMFMPVLLK